MVPRAGSSTYAIGCRARAGFPLPTIRRGFFAAAFRTTFFAFVTRAVPRPSFLPPFTVEVFRAFVVRFIRVPPISSPQEIHSL
jgi:hypothetical protein